LRNAGGVMNRSRKRDKQRANVSRTSAAQAGARRDGDGGEAKSGTRPENERGNRQAQQQQRGRC